ncbi:hypothetical protein [Myroides sp. WP-1]|uniref:hypothetical protein n=1 Tax=Myroides sp. WP-1 TaxID=2759944 RepID=UPI0015FBE19B|nr:hypothetical protein [Myroides sp. WP-1]MBB1138649.1 hypothetical protein [Myroides sp. WP-1]
MRNLFIILFLCLFTSTVFAGDNVKDLTVENEQIVQTKRMYLIEIYEDVFMNDRPYEQLIFQDHACMTRAEATRAVFDFFQRAQKFYRYTIISGDECDI